MVDAARINFCSLNRALGVAYSSQVGILALPTYIAQIAISRPKII